MMRNEEMTNENLVQIARVLRRDMTHMRRQSNRASARRSRLCRQAECAGCAEVHTRLQALRMENQFLRESLRWLYDEWDKISYANMLMKGELSKLAGPEKLPELDVFLRSPFTEG
ncbi:G-box-binding factor 1-like isoform X2 [Cynara cardunculus var. scolymus]|nr:G-box-binding factor 1-like isoform X2 [Cynara cardunculus var. scolymus]XP_024994774.1 G-box-binding factor 1-like isoform X2 [Cynara cardunculus var. scolymus]XP_024994775.1 G-box-binding factor 1-like isoform X2 [Cynara cardunculus var. scolymus]XP_024994776.1 G-box-binding factor 1-like isoform X2 [Cynara cardunculus var. scolymus]XP_024994777.1 G-box-binding factor 1-like isoform X2 [Cynara cardunculus var. scolymus]XP_024994778.1 G-box-binding factor 1-like isoform X2 [Cynara carduncu